MPKIKHIESGQVIAVSDKPVFLGGMWECGDQRFTDPDGSAYLPLTEYPTVGPIHFQMLFTTQEAVAAEAARATDPALNRFWKLIEDPRTDVVNLALASVQDAVEYTLTIAKAAGVDLDVGVRKAEILTGVLH